MSIQMGSPNLLLMTKPPLGPFAEGGFAVPPQRQPLAVPFASLWSLTFSQDKHLQVLLVFPMFAARWFGPPWLVHGAWQAGLVAFLFWSCFCSAVAPQAFLQYSVKGTWFKAKRLWKASYFPASSVAPTLLLQHRLAKSGAGIGEREWGCLGYFNAVCETTAEGCNSTDASLAFAPLRASGAERGSHHPPFTSMADPVLSQPGEVNQKQAL